MKHLLKAFRSEKSKVAILKDYKYPALDSNNTKNIIWLHGMFDSSKNFFNVVEHQDLRKIANQTLIDARNHGLSEHTGVFTVNDMVQDFVDYLANRDMKDIYIVGHSMGGRTVLAALQDHYSFLLERVKGVVIVDTLPCSYKTEGIIPIESIYRFMKEVNSISLEGKKLEEIEQEIKKQFEKSVANNILSSIGTNENGQLKWLNNFPIIEKSFDGLMGFEVKNIMWPGPRKIITGGKSHFTSNKLVHELYPSIFANFNAERDHVEFKDSGHFLYVKEPQRFVGEVVSFIEKVESDNNDESKKKKEKLYDESLTYDV